MFIWLLHLFTGRGKPTMAADSLPSYWYLLFSYTGKSFKLLLCSVQPWWGLYQPGLLATCWYDCTAIIVGEIITKVYPVRMSPSVSRRIILVDLETRLDRWYISLADNLSYDVASRRAIPSPHVLFLHIRYWGAVLLLNRALWVLLLLGPFIMFMSISIPNWKGYKCHYHNNECASHQSVEPGHHLSARQWN